METLSKRPQSVEEIGEANGKHAEFLKKKKEVKIKFFYKKVKGYGCAMNISNIVEIILQWILFDKSKIPQSEKKLMEIKTCLVCWF